MNYLSSIGKINLEGAGARNSTMHEHGHASAKASSTAYVSQPEPTAVLAKNGLISFTLSTVWYLTS